MSKILVIDDEPEIRNLVQMILSKKGVEIQTASSGDEAVKIIDHQVPDIVITDVQMPGMSGLELIRFINKKHPRIPIIVITSFGSYSMVVEALNNGAFYFIPKPFKTGELLKTVQKAARLPRITSERMRTVPFATHVLTLTIPTDLELIDGVTFQLVSAAEAMGFPQRSLTMGIPIAADELLANAILHGNREDPEKRVFVKAVIDQNQFQITIRDEGEGFDSKQTMQTLEQQGGLEDSGRGILIARHYMDSLTYIGKGNEVVATLSNATSRLK